MYDLGTILLSFTLQPQSLPFSLINKTSLTGLRCPRERFYKINNFQNVISSLNKGFEVISSLDIIDINLQLIFLCVYS